jgi:hypothetical protein
MFGVIEPPEVSYSVLQKLIVTVIELPGGAWILSKALETLALWVEKE